MPQQFAQVNYEPLRAAGRSFAQIPGAIAQGVESYQQKAQINNRNEQAYSELTNFFDRTGITYDKEALKPQPNEEGYEERVKKSIAPTIGKLAEGGVDVKALVKAVNTPGVAWNQVDALLKKQAGQEKQQAITQAVGRATSQVPAMTTQQLEQNLGEVVPLEQVNTPHASEAGNILGRQAPKTESEFYGNLANEFSKLPKEITTEEVAGNPALALAQRSFAAKTEENKIAATQAEKDRQLRLKMAMDIWEKVKAGNKVFKAGALVDKPSFQDIYDNVEQYSLETGVAPRASGSGFGSGGQPNELKLQSAVIQRLRQMNASDFNIVKAIDSFGNEYDKYVPKANTYSARVLGDMNEYKKFAAQYFPQYAGSLGITAPPTPQKGSGF